MFGVTDDMNDEIEKLEKKIEKLKAQRDQAVADAKAMAMELSLIAHQPPFVVVGVENLKAAAQRALTPEIRKRYGV